MHRPARLVAASLFSARLHCSFAYSPRRYGYQEKGEMRRFVVFSLPNGIILEEKEQDPFCFSRSGA